MQCKLQSIKPANVTLYLGVFSGNYRYTGKDQVIYMFYNITVNIYFTLNQIPYIYI